jgi:hypothetical protein
MREQGDGVALDLDHSAAGGFDLGSLVGVNEMTPYRSLG